MASPQIWGLNSSFRELSIDIWVLGVPLPGSGSTEALSKVIRGRWPSTGEWTTVRIARRSGAMAFGASGAAPAPPRGSTERAVWMVRVGCALRGRCSVRAAHMSQQHSWRKKIVAPRCPLGGNSTATREAPGHRGTLGVVLRQWGTRGTAPRRKGVLGPALR